jgi:hypothetical protein
LVLADLLLLLPLLLLSHLPILLLNLPLILLRVVVLLLTLLPILRVVALPNRLNRLRVVALLLLGLQQGVALQQVLLRGLAVVRQLLITLFLRILKK